MEPILVDFLPCHGSHSRFDMRAHLIERGMNPDLYAVWYDDENVVATFPLYNGSCNWVGYQEYRPLFTSKKNNDPKEGRYYTYLPSGVDGVFGLETLDHDKKTIYIVEGVFKAANLHRLGYNAIATLSNHPKRMRSWFKVLGANFNLVAIGDNDKAGEKLVKFIGRGACSPKDIDEMSDSEIEEFLKGI